MSKRKKDQSTSKNPKENPGNDAAEQSPSTTPEVRPEAIQVKDTRPEDVAPEVVVDQEFADLIPPQTAEERTRLEASLLTEGCRDPLVVWRGSNTLLDGHLRFALCTKHKIRFNVVTKELSGPEAARDWILANQLGRRNLTPDQASYLRGRRYNSLKQQHGGNRQDAGASVQNEHLKTAERLAFEYATSASTIRRDGKYAEAIDRIVKVCGDAVKREILSGKYGWTQKEVLELAGLSEPEMEGAIRRRLEQGPEARKKSLKTKEATVGQVTTGETAEEAMEEASETVLSAFSPMPEVEQLVVPSEAAVPVQGGDAFLVTRQDPEATATLPSTWASGSLPAEHSGRGNSLSLPDDPPLIAQTLLVRLGRDQAEAVYQELGKLLEKTPAAEGEGRPGGQFERKAEGEAPRRGKQGKKPRPADPDRNG